VEDTSVTGKIGDGRALRPTSAAVREDEGARRGARRQAGSAESPFPGAPDSVTLSPTALRAPHQEGSAGDEGARRQGARSDRASADVATGALAGAGSADEALALLRSLVMAIGAVPALATRSHLLADGTRMTSLLRG
jgi:hypothetical protein